MRKGPGEGNPPSHPSMASANNHCASCETPTVDYAAATSMNMQQAQS